MKNFFDYHYWFNLRPTSLAGGMQKYFLILVVLFLVFTLLLAFLKSKNKNLYSRILRKLYTFFLTNFIIGLLLLFFTYEMVPFLSSRFWFLLWAAGIILWLYFILKEFVKVPKIKEELAKEKEFKKYIP
jgi:phosphoglycerol transferase MdoB-like AlkP superfamily enzyme